MEWSVIVALVLVVPIIFFPTLLIWYINISGLGQVMKSVAKKKILRFTKKTL